jgi:acetyl esterase/lipase
MIQVTDGITYAAVFGYRPLLLDLYVPQAGETAPPVVLFLHGGGWALGDRKLVAPAFGSWEPSFFARLARAGFAVASADYRLSCEARFPAQLHDAKAAVRWLRGHGAEHGFDGERIVAWGASAGGHLAALLGLTGDFSDASIEGTSDEVSSAVSAVVDWYGPADLVALAPVAGGPMEHDSPESPEGRLIGARVSENPALAKAASPVSYVHGGAPPFQIKHGTADRAVPAGQSQTLAGALAAAGVPVETQWVAGAGHMWEGIGQAEVEKIFASSVGFARRVTSFDEGKYR